jgi:hypothetical protein
MKVHQSTRHGGDGTVSVTEQTNDRGTKRIIMMTGGDNVTISTSCSRTVNSEKTLPLPNSRAVRALRGDARGRKRGSGATSRRGHRANLVEQLNNERVARGFAPVRMTKRARTAGPLRPIRDAGAASSTIVPTYEVRIPERVTPEARRNARIVGSHKQGGLDGTADGERKLVASVSFSSLATALKVLSLTCHCVFLLGIVLSELHSPCFTGSTRHTPPEPRKCYLC